jgi:pimeloyl-ACP methyl ester carboxylesterase
LKIFSISGLGADARAFANLRLSDHELIHVPWLKPARNESLPDYSARMLKAIDTSQPFALLGLSFGGLVAQTVSTMCAPEQVMLISSLQSRKELPTLFRLLGGMRLHRLIPGKWLTNYNFLTRHYFGPLSDESRDLLQIMLKETDPSFLKWAIAQIMKFQPIDSVKPTRIHGDQDRIIPFPSAIDCSRVSGGGHLMIIDDAPLISKLINDKLA